MNNVPTLKKPICWWQFVGDVFTLRQGFQGNARLMAHSANKMEAYENLTNQRASSKH